MCFNIIVADFQAIHKLLHLSLPMTKTSITIPEIQPDPHIISSLFGIVGGVPLGGVAVWNKNIKATINKWEAAVLE